VARTARYHLAGAPPREAREAWYLLHGYAQLAAPFLDACAALTAPGRLLAAPEALSRFYAERPTSTDRTGGHGSATIGASWMTREMRDEEIADYLRYLDALDAAIGAPADAPRAALGFSQGAATAARWAARGRTPVARLVLWGSPAPPDLEPPALAARGVRVVLVTGRGDRLFPPERLESEAARLAGAGLRVVTRLFDGGHAIHGPTLAELATLPD